MIPRAVLSDWRNTPASLLVQGLYVITRVGPLRDPADFLGL
jgi:hypothetical protein